MQQHLSGFRRKFIFKAISGMMGLLPRWNRNLL